MLWYKAWLETRVRFAIGLAVLICTAVFIVNVYPRAAQLLTTVPNLQVGGELQRQIQEAVETSRTYRGYIWSQLFTQNLPQTWCLFAAILGAGGLVASRRGGVLYTLSLPVSRRDLVVTRAMVVAGELLVLALIPSLLVCVVSPSVGESYSPLDALVHGVAMFAGGSVFFGLAFLLSSVWDDWRPVMLVIAIAFVVLAAERLVPWLDEHGLSHVISAASYFHGQGVPWLGLALALGTTTAMVYGATLNVARRDF